MGWRAQSNWKITVEVKAPEESDGIKDDGMELSLLKLQRLQEEMEQSSRGAKHDKEINEMK